MDALKIKECSIYSNSQPLKYIDCLKCVGKRCEGCGNIENFEGHQYLRNPLGLMMTSKEASALSQGKQVVYNIPIMIGTGYQPQYLFPRC